MQQNVFIIGATGKVGATLTRQIYARGDTDAAKHTNPTRVVGLASSTTFIASKKGIAQKTALGFVKNKKGKAYASLDELIIAARKIGRDIVFVDVTALSGPMTAFHKKVIGSTPYSIVTANKNPIAYSDYETFLFLTKEPRRYGYRCSVMAGADAVPFLRDLRDVRDRPLAIEGCFSGTLGYITSMLEKNIAFSSVLENAMKRGYTEPDPRDDLNGIDVARKLLVLARSAGFAADFSDVEITPFIGKEYFKKESVGAFLKSIKHLDTLFKNKTRAAKKTGGVLRYVAAMEKRTNGVRLTVRLRQVHAQGPLGSLRGTSNKIIVASKTLGETSPYSIQGPGAGLDITAQNIRRDLLYLLEKRSVVR